MNDTSGHQRFNDSLLARHERSVLVMLARHTPRWISPDRMTMIGILGAFLAFWGFALSNRALEWLWLANAGLVIHWLGDSLDGTLARVRAIERPRYGFYLDQVIDTVGNLLIGAGVAVAPFARPDIALIVLALYQMLAIQVLVRTIVDREFHVAVGRFGPTELRIGIVLMNIGVLLFGGTEPIWTTPIALGWCDLLMLALIGFLAFLFVSQMVRHLKRLEAEEGHLENDV